MEWYRAQRKALVQVLVIVVIGTLSHMSERNNTVALGKTEHLDRWTDVLN